MSEDFSGHPISIGEAKATRDSDCRLWTPRDALISLLREIDSGATKPDALMVIYRETDGDGGSNTGFLNATPDVHTALGLLARGQFRLMDI